MVAMATKLPWQPSMWLMPIIPMNLLTNMNSIQLKAKELLMFHSGCHGNSITIATRYVADDYHPKEVSYQI